MFSLKAAGRAHQVTLIEGGPEVPGTEPMPGYFSMHCACGWTSYTFWGAMHAEEMAQRHIFVKATEMAITPGGANADRR